MSKPLYTSIVFIPASQLPVEDGDYLTISKSGASVYVLHFSTRANAFNCMDEDDSTKIDVAYWAYIPENMRNVLDQLWEEYENEHQ